MEIPPVFKVQGSQIREKENGLVGGCNLNAHPQGIISISFIEQRKPFFEQFSFL